MNAPRWTPDNSIDFLIASPGPVRCPEAARGQPASPVAPAHDSFPRLLNRLEPDPETRWQEAEPLVETNQGVLVLDDSTHDLPDATHIGLVTRPWSGKPKQPVRGINPITLVWTDGDRTLPCDSRLSSKAEGTTKNDHFWAMMVRAKGCGVSPRGVPFDGGEARLEGLTRVRDFGGHWLTRLTGHRTVTPADRRSRTRDEVAISASGTRLPLKGSGRIQVFRSDAPDGDAETWATHALGRDEWVRREDAERGFQSANEHRDLKPFCGVAKCQVRAARAQRHPLGMAVRAFLRLEWHFFTTGISAFEAEMRVVRDAVRSYLARPALTLPRQANA